MMSNVAAAAAAGEVVAVAELEAIVLGAGLRQREMKVLDQAAIHHMETLVPAEERGSRKTRKDP